MYQQRPKEFQVPELFLGFEDEWTLDRQLARRSRRQLVISVSSYQVTIAALLVLGIAAIASDRVTQRVQ